MPTQEECPECVFGRWSCEASCSPGTDFNSLSTNFTYHATESSCFEQVPLGTHKISVDTDLFCYFGGFMTVSGPNGEETLGCNNMRSYSLYGAFIRDCVPQSFAALDLLSEQCSWVCKRVMYPTIRCAWSFDPQGWFTQVGATMDMCWLRKSCIHGRVVTDAACRPVPSWSRDNSTQLERARMRLAAVRTKHLANGNRLKEAEQQFGSNVSAEAAEARLRRAESEVELVIVVEGMNVMIASLRQETSSQNLSAVDLLATEAHRQLVGEHLGAFLSELSLVLDETQDSSAAHNAAAQELEVTHTLYREIQSELERSKEQQLDSEEKQSSLQLSLDASKEKMEEEERKKEKEKSKNSALVIVIAVLCVLLFCGALAAGYICYAMSSKPPVIHGNMEGQVASDGGVMVVGRPVNADSVERPPGRPPGGKVGANDPLRAAGSPSKVGSGAPPPKKAW